MRMRSYTLQPLLNKEVFMNTQLLILLGPFVVLFGILAYFDNKNRTDNDHD